MNKGAAHAKLVTAKTAAAKDGDQLAYEEYRGQLELAIENH
ncbi:MAG: hypothetical protein ACRD98_08490 [Nitrososphaera sp.]